MFDFSPWAVENTTRHYRDQYLLALFRRDVDFIERFSPGRLGQRFSEESSRIVEGLGPGLGLIVRSLSSLFSGIVIGMTRVLVYLFWVSNRIGCSLSWLYLFLLLSFSLVINLIRAMEDTQMLWWKNIRTLMLLPKRLSAILKRLWV